MPSTWNTLYLYWTEHAYLHDTRIWRGSTHLNKQSCSAEVALDVAGFFSLWTLWWFYALCKLLGCSGCGQELFDEIIFQPCATQTLVNSGDSRRDDCRCNAALDFIEAEGKITKWMVVSTLNIFAIAFLQEIKTEKFSDWKRHKVMFS